MMLPSSLLLLSSVVGLVTSQSTGSIDPSTIDQATRDYWCQSQTSSCPLICLQLPGASGDPTSNSCDSSALTYQCVCDNGISPNASQYSLTIPYFICSAENNNCVTNCASGDSTCQSNCRSQHPCGAQDPKRVNVTTTAAATATASGSGSSTDVVYNGFGATATAASDKGAASKALAIDVGRVYGVFVVLGGFFAGFTLLL